MQQHHTIFDFSTSNSWVILSPIEQRIKHKIEAAGTPLKDWDINIYRGVLTGYNEAFVISTDKRDHILANCQTEEERLRTEELIRPNFRLLLACLNFLLYIVPYFLSWPDASFLCLVISKQVTIRLMQKLL